ncbi:hypothetical protein OXPF_41740 [Oxobacter pfennigii]|uniref:Tocopherol cyclase n=1 Tax=Oxobacter pfennigii TaxID=36849 RepID=A0A0P8W436_9CLOT|nr:tocopherol cyclase family protein [Oxobacter pfennigii]KPU42389.1 hypothetical protein OXPF_41740 [Oxobacter pfennigii]
MFKVFRQEAFLGKLSYKRYFEGWYFKHVSRNLLNAYSFIPGISLCPENPHAFIQVIDGVTGETKYIQYSLDEFSWDSKGFMVKVGHSVFTDKHISVNIQDEKTKIAAKINYKDSVKYPKSLLSPGIMGWYSYVPYMECKHAIVSLNHDLWGEMSIDGKTFDFTGGKGYIEKDWGTSFPKEWLWLHCNNFESKDASVFISIANIPWLKSYFIGFIAFLYTGKELFRFATYNKSKITKLVKVENSIHISIMNNKYKMDMEIQPENSGVLMAPVMGNMDRRIKESIDSKVTVRLEDTKGGIIFGDNGIRAGLEVIDSIFHYFI